MHSPLFKDHPQCEDLVKLLVECHEKHSVAKFWGKCNEIKSELDYCFMQEKIKRRDTNLKKAREFDTKFEAYQARVKATSDKE